MARKKKRTRRRKFTGLNATNIVEGYTYANLLTKTLFEVDPFTFVFGSSVYTTGSPYHGVAAGAYQLSLKELIAGFNSTSGADSGWSGKTSLDIVKLNADRNMMDGIVNGVLLGAGWRIGRKLTATPRRKANKMLKDFGLGDVIRV